MLFYRYLTYIQQDECGSVCRMFFRAVEMNALFFNFVRMKIEKNKKPTTSVH